MKFAFLGYHREQNWQAMSQAEQDAMVEECFTYDRKLLKDGHLIDTGMALQPSPTAKTLRWRSGAVVVTDGPYAETKEQLGGIGLLEARDMVHAVELMAQHPGLHYGSTFEIRPVDEATLERLASSIARLRPGAPAAGAQALTFASFGYIDENRGSALSKDEREAMLQSCIAFDEARVKSGQMLNGMALQSARTAKTLRAQAGKIAVTDGPFAETKEYLGGVVVLALPSLADAVASISEHPALPLGVTIEIRPIHEEVSRRWHAKVGRG
jgi:hypothetical protein